MELINKRGSITMVQPRFYTIYLTLCDSVLPNVLHSRDSSLNAQNDDCFYAPHFVYLF